ncbi:MAG: N-6 DNA methylase [Candidatus Omnitrophica bacterium]|nr:N-6 DNA methylase [Candidatus Omnitrophota bacterium]
MLNKTDFKKLISEYLYTSEGQSVLSRYKKTCDITPKNIYVDEVDFFERYKEEAFTIYLCLNHLCSSGFILSNIYKEIPELATYYPWLRSFKNSFQESTPQSSFIISLKKWLTEFFSVINQRRYGEYYTPLELVRLSFKNIDFDISNKVVDPSCGCGFFIYAYIEKLYESALLRNKQDLCSFKNNLYGYDIFPFPVIITKFLAGHILSDIFNLKNGIFKFKNIKIANTLHTLKCKSKKYSAVKFDLIIGNPPFFRIDPNNDNRICSCISYGHNYSHSLFLHWSIQYLKENGKLCLFLPQSILSGYYYQKLRKQLINECSIDLIITNKEHEGSFFVQQDIMILIATKSHLSKEYFNVGTSSSDFSTVRTFRLPTKLMENDLCIIPIFKNKLQYNTLRGLSTSRVVPILSRLNLGTGNFVWNQNKKRCFKNYRSGSYPLINGPNITLRGIKLGVKKSEKVSYCRPNKKKYIKSGAAILCRRMSPIGNSRRMIAAMMHNGVAKEYVVENHVNIITNNNGKKELNQVMGFLMSKDFNTLINAICHTNQVSTNELKILFELLQRIKLSQAEIV